MTNEGPYLIQVDVEEKIRGDSALMAAVDRANHTLEAEIDARYRPLKFHWSLIQDEQWKPYVILEINYGNVVSSARSLFSLDGLIHISDSRLAYLMSRLWGDLLQERAHRELDQMEKGFYEMVKKIREQQT